MGGRFVYGLNHSTWRLRRYLREALHLRGVPRERAHVLGDALDGPLSAFPLGPYPPHLRAKPKMGARPAQFMKGVNVPISKQHVWAKGPPGASQRIGKPALSTTKGSTPKNGPTQRTKCVWKQQVTW